MENGWKEGTLTVEKKKRSRDLLLYLMILYAHIQLCFFHKILNKTAFLKN